MGVKGKTVLASGSEHKGEHAFFFVKILLPEALEHYKLREISSFIISFVPP